MMRFDAQLIQGGIIVVEVNAATMQDAEWEIQHYASLYAQDGPIKIKRLYKNEEEQK